MSIKPILLLASPVQFPLRIINQFPVQAQDWRQLVAVGLIVVAGLPRITPLTDPAKISYLAEVNKEMSFDLLFSELYDNRVKAPKRLQALLVDVVMQKAIDELPKVDSLDSCFDVVFKQYPEQQDCARECLGSTLYDRCVAVINVLGSFA